MSDPQQSQFPFPDSQLKIYNWLEDDDENISETKVESEDVSEEDEKDWFLEAFLVGYRIEKDRRKREEQKKRKERRGRWLERKLKRNEEEKKEKISKID